MRLIGQTALITGAAIGIGKEVSLTLARDGADVAVTDLRSNEINEVAKEIQGLGRRALAIPADVSKYGDVQRMVGEVVDAFGKIDILVNCAAISDDSAPIQDLSLEKWEKMIDVTLNGTFFCSQIVGREMIKRRKGKIISIASTAGLAATPFEGHYTVAKHGVVGLTKALAVEWGRYGITANCICPGLTETPTTKKSIEQDPDWFGRRIARIPLGRIAQPSDQARVVAFLASADSDYLNGHALVLDGGTNALYAGFSLPPTIP